MPSSACDVRHRTPEECYAIARDDAARRYRVGLESNLVEALLALKAPPNAKTARAAWRGERDALLAELETSFGLVVALVGELSSRNDGQEWTAIVTSQVTGLTFTLVGGSKHFPSSGDVILVSRRYLSGGWDQPELTVYRDVPAYVATDINTKKNV